MCSTQVPASAGETEPLRACGVRWHCTPVNREAAKKGQLCEPGKARDAAHGPAHTFADPTRNCPPGLHAWEQGSRPRLSYHPAVRLMPRPSPLQMTCRPFSRTAPRYTLPPHTRVRTGARVPLWPRVINPRTWTSHWPAAPCGTGTAQPWGRPASPPAQPTPGGTNKVQVQRGERWRARGVQQCVRSSWNVTQPPARLDVHTRTQIRLQALVSYPTPT